MNGIIHGIQITTLSGWLACTLGYVAGFRIPQIWQLDFPEKPKPMKCITELDFTLGSPDLVIEDSTEAPGSPEITEIDPQTEVQIEASPTEALAPAPPEMPELANAEPLPDIPEMPVQVIRKVANKVVSKQTGSTKSDKKSAVTTSGSSNSNGPPSKATRLTAGSGAGRQPSPQYPFQARRANQQGTVVIEFIVGIDGRVLSAWVQSPCPWPLLNNTALSTVRSRWKFPSGPARRYSIPIVFRLS